MDNTPYELTATGGVLTGTNDLCSFLYQELQGDGDFTAQLVSRSPNAPIESRYGIMIRQSDQAAAPFAFLGASPICCWWAYRSKPNERGREAPQPVDPVRGIAANRGLPKVLLLHRTGDHFAAYAKFGASDSKWEWVGEGDVSIGARPCLAGFAACSGNATNPVTVQFDKPEWLPLRANGKVGPAKEPTKSPHDHNSP